MPVMWKEPLKVAKGKALRWQLHGPTRQTGEQGGMEGEDSAWPSTTLNTLSEKPGLMVTGWTHVHLSLPILIKPSA